MIKSLFVTIVLGLYLTGACFTAFAQQSMPKLQTSGPNDANIFAIFDEVNSVDIWTARLGVKKGHAPEVRELARSVANDHEQVQQMMRDLAHKLAINPVPLDHDNNAEEQAKTITLLQAKNGEDFDRTYLLHEIEFHKGSINAVKQTLLPAIHDEEFKSLVQKILPGLEHHLNETIEVVNRLGYK